MSLKSSVIGLVLLALVGGVLYFGTQKQDNPVGAQSANLTDGSCLSQNGAHICMYTQRIHQATTTPCSFPAPAASSTVQVNVRVDTASSSATTWDVAQASTAYATTTNICSVS